MADEIKPVNITASVAASTEYTDDKGIKVVVSEQELTPDSLKNAGIYRLESIANLSELKAKELCQNCRFWNPVEMRQNKDGKLFPINGECRVNAPEIVLRSIAVVSEDTFTWRDQDKGVFPLIGPFQWCGKYERIA